MVRRLFQFKRDGMPSDDNRFDGLPEDTTTALTLSDPSGEDVYPEQGLSAGFDSFREIYGRATEGAPPSGYTVLTVSSMLNSPHLAGMSTESKRGSIMMALDAAGVHVTDILQDAMLRQRALEEYEEQQQKKLRAFEAAKGEANRKLQAELDRITSEYMTKIQSNVDEVAPTRCRRHRPSVLSRTARPRAAASASRWKPRRQGAEIKMPDFDLAICAVVVIVGIVLRRAARTRRETSREELSRIRLLSDKAHRDEAMLFE